MKEWRHIKGYEGLYVISNKGEVISLFTHKLLKPSIKNYKNGYAGYTLYKNDKHTQFLAHRLVAQNFIDNPECKPEVNHINGNKLDNSVENLEWCTRFENQQHAVKNGLQAKGERQHLSKITPDEVRVMRRIYNKKEFSSHRLAKIFSLHQTSVSDILSFRTWKHI